MRVHKINCCTFRPIVFGKLHWKHYNQKREHIWHACVNVYMCTHIQIHRGTQAHVPVHTCACIFVNCFVHFLTINSYSFSPLNVCNAHWMYITALLNLKRIFLSFPILYQKRFFEDNFIHVWERAIPTLLHVWLSISNSIKAMGKHW